MANENGNSFMLTPIGRVSFPNVFKPYKDDNGKEKYQLTLLFPKEDKECIEFLKGLKVKCKQLAQSVFKGVEDVAWDPIKDGDKKEWDGYKGHYFIRMKTQFPPKVVDAKRQDVFDDDTKNGLYAGCWARCYLNLYNYNTKGNKGVSLGLGNIQKAQNDEPFTGGGKAADQFEALDVSNEEVAISGDDDLFGDDLL